MIWEKENYEKLKKIYKLNFNKEINKIDILNKKYNYSEEKIKLVEDVSERVSLLLEEYSYPELIKQIRELEKKNISLTEIAWIIGEKSLKIGKNLSKEFLLDRAIRIYISIVNGGFTLAMMEGIQKVEIIKEKNNNTYLKIFFGASIRTAGGTVQALSLLFLDVLRKKLNIGKYKYSDEEIKRFIEERDVYDKNYLSLQYVAKDEEIILLLKKFPILLCGYPLRLNNLKITKFPYVRNVSHNFLRTGPVLLINEGLCLKKNKLLFVIKKKKIKDWEFLQEMIDILKIKKEDSKDLGKKFNEFLAGRPLFSEGKIGSFRIAYGKSFTNGFCAISVNPVISFVLNKFISFGTQLRTTYPGKASLVTYCSNLMGPLILFSSGNVKRINTLFEFEKIKNKEKIIRILDLGEILLSLGDVLENNKKTVKIGNYFSSFPHLKKKFPNLINYTDTPFFINLKWKEIFKIFILNYENKIKFEEKKINIDFSEEILKIFFKLLIEFEILNFSFKKENELFFGKRIVLDRKKYGKIFNEIFNLKNSFFEEKKEKFEEKFEEKDLDLIFKKIKLISPNNSYYPCKMGRPEKIGERKKIYGRISSNIIFKLGKEKNSRKDLRKIKTISLKKNDKRICRNCGNRETVFFICEICNKKTYFQKNKSLLKEYDFELILEKKLKNYGLDKKKIGLIKGSDSKILNFEILEKGIFRAKNKIFCFRDGTTRMDGVNIPITHFYPEKINVSIKKLKELGYEKDCYGKEIINSNQIIPIFPQDIILPKSSLNFFLRVGKFFDEIMEFVYKEKKIYNFKSIDEIIGKYFITIAPHISVGTSCRLIGYVEDLNGILASPFLHSLKRRNCDGDEDGVMLMMESLFNFNKKLIFKKNGCYQDVPLLLNKEIRFQELDKEVFNLEYMNKYSEKNFSFFKDKKKLDSSFNFLKNEKNIKNYKLFNVPFNFPTKIEDFFGGNMLNSYKTVNVMIDKISKMVKLCKKIQGIEIEKMIESLITSHLVPDIIGNFRKYFIQKFRCTNCGLKFSPKIFKKCINCKNKNLVQTIHKKSLMKYLYLIFFFNNKFKLNKFMKEKLNFIISQIKKIFGELVEENLENSKILEEIFK